MEVEQQKKSYAGYKLVILLLVVGLAGLTFWYVRESNEWQEINQQISDERDEISEKLSNMLLKYDDLKTTNSAINQELETEKAKIQTLLREITSNKKMHYAEIRQYEKETNTLRDIMRSYIHQIDSLNTLSQKLLAENREVKQNLQSSQEENLKLSKEKENLSSQVEKGSILKVRNIEASGLNSRNKDTYSASRSKKLRACFTINENAIAKAGSRFVYIRIIGPNEALLTNSDSEGVLEVQEQKLAYSAKREVDYQNQDLETCVFFDAKDMKLIKGGYTVEVYIDGNLSGSGQFLMK
jgi:predicted  nucleic acid-binding Zn-ribbon protein